MSIVVGYYGGTKPGPGVKPLRVETNPKLPFGKKPALNWWTGKHIALHKDPAPAASTGDGGPAEDPGTEVDTLGAAAEGSETALTDSWTAGGDHGLAVWCVSRVVYNEAGDKILYEFFRLHTYDSNGRLYSVSAETRVEVDATVDET